MNIYYNATILEENNYKFYSFTFLNDGTFLISYSKREYDSEDLYLSLKSNFKLEVNYEFVTY